eukprot:6575568-Lingulodinium_polyedra.AAC.1
MQQANLDFEKLHEEAKALAPQAPAETALQGLLAAVSQWCELGDAPAPEELKEAIEAAQGALSRSGAGAEPAAPQEEGQEGHPEATAEALEPME